MTDYTKPLIVPQQTYSNIIVHVDPICMGSMTKNRKIPFQHFPPSLLHLVHCYTGSHFVKVYGSFHHSSNNSRYMSTSISLHFAASSVNRSQKVHWLEKKESTFLPTGPLRGSLLAHQLPSLILCHISSFVFRFCCFFVQPSFIDAVLHNLRVDMNVVDT